ncbi:hypothetical protein YTPLAS18_16750 [Nitrospira sp.]|nr:hypothetical protein YTPLAS18_16750 [Nitrospira sp.]
MFPTLMKGDRLVIEWLPPPDDDEHVGICAGDLLLYVTHDQLCCHRALQRTTTGDWIARGDATTGTGEVVPRQAVRGKVTRILRGTSSFAPDAPPLARRIDRARRAVDLRLQTYVGVARKAVRASLIAVLTIPSVCRVVRAQITVRTSTYPDTLEARWGRVTLGTWHCPSRTLTQRTWTDSLRLNDVFSHWST